MNFGNMAALAKHQGLSLKKKDPVKEHVKEKLEKLDIKDENEVNKVKELIESLNESKSGKTSQAAAAEAPARTEACKEDDTKDAADKKDKEEEGAKEEEKAKPRRAGALNLDLFMKVKEISLCCDEDIAENNAKHCVNILMLQREGRTIEAVKGPRRPDQPIGRGRGNRGRIRPGADGPQRQRVSKEVEVMLAKAAVYKSRVE